MSFSSVVEGAMTMKLRTTSSYICVSNYSRHIFILSTMYRNSSLVTLVTYLQRLSMHRSFVFLVVKVPIYSLILPSFYRLIALSSIRFIFLILGMRSSILRVSFRFLAWILSLVMLRPRSSTNLSLAMMLRSSCECFLPE